MKSKGFSWAVRIIAVLALALPFGALAPSPMPEHLGGIINDYTAATGVSGPWEMHGTWSLKIEGGSGKADFSAVMTMEHPDSWIAMNPGTPSKPNGRLPCRQPFHHSPFSSHRPAQHYRQRNRRAI
jgi:hypothetical protein